MVTLETALFVAFPKKTSILSLKRQAQLSKRQLLPLTFKSFRKSVFKGHFCGMFSGLLCALGLRYAVYWLFFPQTLHIAAFFFFYSCFIFDTNYWFLGCKKRYRFFCFAPNYVWKKQIEK